MHSSFPAEPRFRSLLLRGLHYALVVSADTVLLQDCRIPVGLFSEVHAVAEETMHRQARRLIGALKPAGDYEADHTRKTVRLTDAGRRILAAAAGHFGGYWSSAGRREAAVVASLEAELFFDSGKHYVVRGGKLSLLAEAQNRLHESPDAFSAVLALCVKEGCPAPSRHEPGSQTTYLEFFSRYLRLGGFAPDAARDRSEYLALYGVSVAKSRVPVAPGDGEIQRHVCATENEKWSVVIEVVREALRAGRQVAIVVPSRKMTHDASLRLGAHGLSGRILPADRATELTEAISGFGDQSGKQWIAVVAGIPAEERILSRFVREMRQLGARCELNLICSLEDELFVNNAPRWLQHVCGALIRRDQHHPLAWRCTAAAQTAAARELRRTRRRILKRSRQLKPTGSGRLADISEKR
jgi:preprotein translocase subunit SecA